MFAGSRERVGLKMNDYFLFLKSGEAASHREENGQMVIASP